MPPKIFRWYLLFCFMKYFIMPVLFFFCKPALSQKQSNQATNYTIKLAAGQSFAGTGDIQGFYITTGIQKSIKRWNYALELTNTVHDKEHQVFYTSVSGEILDASVRSSTAGLQIEGTVSNSFIKDEKEELAFAFGILTRYQTTSQYFRYVIFTSASTNLPYPLVLIDNLTPMRTLSIGTMAKMSYQYKLSSKWAAGISLSFQLDTNEDTFFNKGFMVVYKL
jgi:hypothetical protein